jgi:ribosome maturation factor RimP
VYRDIPEELRVLIEPVVDDAGFELVDVLIRRGGQPWLVRITIDTQSADGRVPVERCADVSREVETRLDAANAIPASYRLEVSSPGLDRLLSREKDFAAARGARIQVETYTPLDGRRRFRQSR